MDKYDKMTDETLNKAYTDFLDSLKFNSIGSII